MPLPLPSWRIGYVLGIPIRIHASWVFVFFLVSWTLSTEYFPENVPGLSSIRYWAMGVTASVLLFLSVLLHELGHASMAMRYRLPIDRITLFFFGGVAQMRQEAPSPRAECLIAVAGPLVSLLLGGASLGVAVLVEPIQQELGLHGLITLGVLLGAVNVQLGLFNLIPGFPLDGGRILRAGLWAWGKDFDRATRQASSAGLGFGGLLMALGLVAFVGALVGALPGTMASSGGWVTLIGMFLCTAALSSRRYALLRQSLAALAIRELMVSDVVSVPPTCTLEEAVSRYFQPYGYGGCPVVDNGRLVGLVTVYDIQTVPVSLWGRRTVEQVMRPASPALTVAPDAGAIQAMDQMTREGWDRLVVVQNEQIIGLVTRSAIVRFLDRGSSAGRH